MLSLSRPQLSQFAVASTVALLCLLGIGGFQVPQLNKLIDRGKTASVENINREVELERLRLRLLQKAPSLGFDNLIANWVYLGFLQYFGDELARGQTGYELSPAYFEIIVDRDPRFLGSYISLTASLSLYAGKPEQSVALMAKGLKSMSPKIPPQSYYVWRYKAIDELLFLADIKSAQRSFAKAGEWASTYPDAESQNVAAISRRTAQFLAGNPDKARIKNAQEAIWATVIVNALQANDSRTSDIAIRQIEARGGKVTITPEGGVSVQLP
ncbi:hypothetical protein [Microseira wollei]|uniref:Tetratricopeptide repeat protein n=1 Tax=Microseira wollei NIES-4236 TaxID=2530354 RepID=A0AAV3XN90_9CYAN|nr:hypothetical protein [Microseira wollei]GET41947.1 hypothetical protein MiSe_67610 [Microseira wollei NIES-4236]